MLTLGVTLKADYVLWAWIFSSKIDSRNTTESVRHNPRVLWVWRASASVRGGSSSTWLWQQVLADVSDDVRWQCCQTSQLSHFIVVLESRVLLTLTDTHSVYDFTCQPVTVSVSSCTCTTSHVVPVRRAPLNDRSKHSHVTFVVIRWTVAKHEHRNF